MHNNTEHKENSFINLLLNIILPSLVLIFLSKDKYLGTTLGLVVALSFPIGYGVYDFIRVKKLNLFSALGVISVLLTGGISLFELDPKYIAIKEAAIPALIGIATLISMYTKYPLVKSIVYNEKLMQVSAITTELAKRGNEKAFERVLKNSSILVSTSFFLSAFLNYALAKYIVVSAPGTEQFNAELGKMQALSYVVIMIPSLAVLFASVYYLFHNIGRLTGLSFDNIFNVPEEQKKDSPSEEEKIWFMPSLAKTLKTA